MYHINYHVLKKYSALILKFKKKNPRKFARVMIEAIFGFMYPN